MSSPSRTTASRSLLYLSLSLLAAVAGCGERDESNDVVVKQSALIPAAPLVNCGSTATGAWVGDTNFTGGSTLTRSNTIDLSGVVNPAPMAVYQSQRYGTFSYSFGGLPPGSNNWIRLHFADTHFTTVNARLFNVTINGTQVLTNFDVVATAGGGNKALTEAFTMAADASGGYLIQFKAVKDQATVSGIEMRTAVTPAYTEVACGGPAVGGYVADRGFSGGTTLTRTNTIDTTAAINPAPAAVYQSQRFGNMTYTLGFFMPGSFNKVRLHFADTHFTTTNQRLFNVTVNGAAFLTSFDVVQAAGAGNKAVVKELRVAAPQSGAYVIQFTSVKDQATISGIEIVPSGTWQTVTQAYPGPGINHMQLLMDGSILANDGSPSWSTWRRFVPDPVNGYAGGTWTNGFGPTFTAVPKSAQGRQYFANGMLSDGRYVVCGGEYVYDQAGTPVNNTCYPDGSCNYNFTTNPCGTTAPICPKHNRCEIYDPLANTWMSTPDFPGGTGSRIDDSTAAVLPNGRLLIGQKPVPGNQSMEFDSTQCPSGLSSCPGNPWVSPAPLPPNVFFAEGSMVLMQTGKVFHIARNAALYDPVAHAWSSIIPGLTNSPGVTRDPFDESAGEGGATLLLMDGRVLVTGGTSFNGLFDPDAFNPTTGTKGNYTNVASTPSARALFENDQAVLPDGNAFLGAIDLAFAGAYRFYEYSPPTSVAPLGIFSDVTSPTFSRCNLLQTPLPDGTMFVGNSCSKTVSIYRPDSAQLAGFGQPSIASLTGPVNGLYTLTGNSLNGLTNGANRDDEGENYTSFPIVALTSGNKTWYGAVAITNSRSVTPDAVSSIKFALPALLPRPLTVTVSASGLRSSNSVQLNN
jgi:hypothetical protein